MRKYALIGAGVMLVVAGCLIAAIGLASGLQPVGAEEAEDVLAAVRLGCETTTARVSTSAGVVTVHEWNWRSNGELLETETLYTVASEGERFKAAVDTRYIRNEWTPPDPDLRVNAPGTVQRQEIAYDGEKITSYEPDRNRAEISGLDSDGGRLLRTVKLMALSPGHAVPRLPTSSPSPEGVNRGPHVVARDILNGDECIVVESVRTATAADGTQQEYYSRFWVMPQKGFSVARSETEARGGMFGEGTLLSQAEIDTREYADALWGISEVRHEEYRLQDSGRPYLKSRTITAFADEYQLNGPVTKEMLTIDLPSGTKVYNELIDAEYTVP